MTTDTKCASNIADRLAHRGFAVTSVICRTPDGRQWIVETATVGFRLFEIGVNGRRDEHDAPESETWDPGDMVDYLDAIGRTPTTNNRSS